MVLLIGLALLWSAYIIWRIYILARFYQLEGYQSSRFGNWLKASRSRWASNRTMVGLIVGTGVGQILIAIGLDQPFVQFFWWAVVGFTVAWPEPVKEVKKHFVRTQRAMRLVITGCIVAAVLMIMPTVLMGLASDSISAGHLFTVGVLGWVLFILSPIFLPLGNLLMFPVEASLRRGFIEKARHRLKESTTTVIGITGSYGKTSTKVYLAHILAGKFRVLATPKSYNTLMGVCITINNSLDPEYGYDYFITEMGAYIRGEIKEICDLVHPEIGVLIAIGPQHLERFGSIENIEIAKYELIEALPDHGVGVFNWDDLRVRVMAQRPHPNTRYGVSIHSEDNQGPRVEAGNVRHTVDGMAFEVVDNETGDHRTFNTKLIGLHNVTNILLATAVARHAGMSLNEIALRVATLQPEEHRLNRTVLPNGVTILDDAYNTNPVGAANALDALALYTTGRRILITPGMVELADLQDIENEKLGKLAAEKCTDIILVGQNQTLPIQKGVKTTNFDTKHLLVMDTVQEAIEWYQATVQAGDAVLFLNDLSDNYL